VSLVGAGTGVTTRVGTGAGGEQGRRAVLGGGLGTGDGRQEAAADGTGTGAAVPTSLGRELATGLGGSAPVRGKDGTAVGAAAAGAVVPAAVAAADGTAVPVVPVFGEPEFGEPVSGAAGTLALCDALDPACPPPEAAAVPEHPASARPAATPSPTTPTTRIPSTVVPGTVVPSTGPVAARRVFSFVRICWLLDVVPLMTFSTGKYVQVPPKLRGNGSNLSPAPPV
jgi:hypothetical protein